MGKVKAEAEGVLDAAGPLPSRERLETLTWTVAALKETLRLYSVVPVVTRVAVVRCAALPEALCPEQPRP